MNCIEHKGHRDSFGYGKVQKKFQDEYYFLAHRYAWAVANKKHPGDLCVLHRCDNPSCINVAHLFLGTRTDNNADMVAKGRNYITPKLTQCKRGHDLTKPNSRKPVGLGQCRKCANILWNKYNAEGRCHKERKVGPKNSYFFGQAHLSRKEIMLVYKHEAVGNFWYNRIRAKSELLIEDPESIHDFKNNMLSEGIYDSFPKHTTEFLHIIEELCFPWGLPSFLMPFISAPVKGNPKTLRFYNCKTTLADIEYVYMAHQLANQFRHDSRTIVEIGAGYGGLCDKLTRITTKISKYTLIDFSPHVKLQQYFLEERKELEYCSVNTFPQEPFDLVINTRSMMEMDLNEIGFYIEQIQKWLKPGGLFYLITKDKVTKVADYPFDKKWVTSRSCMFPTPNRAPMTEYFFKRLK